MIRQRMSDDALGRAKGIADPHLMLAFDQVTVPGWLADRLADSPPAGVSLFREWNIVSPDQTAELTTELQRANASSMPLLIAADQEGGQLVTLTGSTPFAGNMAIGATGDTDLAYRVGVATGRELLSVGINTNYAPAVDVATQPENPSLGVRSFGDDADAVARFAGSMASGLIDGGVLASSKHFPGKGEALVDPHYDMPVLNLDRDRLEAVELLPFRSAIEAGTQILMVGHYAVPAITSHDDLPISVSQEGIDGLARQEMGFEGVIITDALDMGALDQGPTQVVEIIAMMRAGIDLLLCMPDPALQERVRSAVERGFSRGLIPEAALAASRKRISDLRSAIKEPVIDPTLVGNAEHVALASELATRATTLIRDKHGVLPLITGTELSIFCIEPTPANLTPADTTELYPPTMAKAFRSFHPAVTELVYPHSPSEQDIAGLISQARQHDAVVVGTVFAGESQADLVNALLQTDLLVITVALRTPFDLAMYPHADIHICTYSSHEPSMRALASAVFGETAFQGRLPAAIPALYPTGHGMVP